MCAIFYERLLTKQYTSTNSAVSNSRKQLTHRNYKSCKQHIDN